MAIDKTVLAAVEQVAMVEHDSGYLLSELTGAAYQKALLGTLRHMRDEHGIEFESIPALIRWIDDEYLEYTKNGQLMGGVSIGT